MRIFVTGISGLFGLNAALALGSRHEVWGAYSSHPVVLRAGQTFELDLANGEELGRIFQQWRPDVVIHAAAYTSVDGCEERPFLAAASNITVTRVVAREAQRVGAQFVYLSSDQLFDGTTPYVEESTVPVPLNVYGQTKWKGEQVTLNEAPDSVVVRTNFYGWGPGHKPSFSDWIIRELRGGRPVNGFVDVFFTPILVNHLVERIERLVLSSGRGVYHVGGCDRVSKYEFACALAHIFDLDAELVQPSTVNRGGLRAMRPHDMSLSSAKVMNAFGLCALGLCEGLAELRRLEQRGWNEDIQRLLDQPA